MSYSTAVKLKNDLRRPRFSQLTAGFHRGKQHENAKQ